MGNSGTLKRHWFEDAGLQNITVPKNGYIFVYVSKESNLNVFFDNAQVIHKPGALLEEMERSGIRPNKKTINKALGKRIITLSD